MRVLVAEDVPQIADTIAIGLRRRILQMVHVGALKTYLFIDGIAYRNRPEEQQ